MHCVRCNRLHMSLSLVCGPCAMTIMALAMSYRDQTPRKPGRSTRRIKDQFEGEDVMAGNPSDFAALVKRPALMERRRSDTEAKG